MKRHFLTFLLFSIFVLVYLFSTSKSAYACSGTSSRPATPCEPAVCGGTNVSGVWQAYIDYSDFTDFQLGICTQLEYFPDSSCDLLRARASNPCSASCNSDSECGEGVCASGNPSTVDVCSGNRGSKPWWCQGYNCGYDCNNSSNECKPVPIGQGFTGYGSLSACEQLCVAHPTPPPEVPVTPPADTPPPGVTITPTSPPSLRCDKSKGQCGCVPGTGCKDGSSTDFRCCYRACDPITKQCKTTFGQGRNNTCNSDPDCKILQCNQAYGTCGCVPGTGCKDGLSTDFRCCYRTCDLAKQQCVTKFSLGKLNTNGVLNKCNNDPNCKSSRFAGHCTMSNGQNYYVVTGTSCSNCSYAKYADGTFAWQGESIPQSSSLTHWVKSGTSFDWYVNNVKIGSGRCNTAGKSQCGQEGCISDDDCDSAYQCVDQCN